MTETSEQDIGTPLFEMEPVPTFTEPENSSGTPCEAQLAQLQAAMATMASRLESVVTAVNSIGEIVDGTDRKVTAVMQFVDGFQKQFAGMSPMDMLKQVMRGGS